MEHQLKKLARAFSQIRLTDAERSAMREALLVRISNTQLPASRIPSPYAGFFMTLAWQRTAAFLLVIAVIGGGASGAAIAAENAVPGDTMYAVKVEVTEPLYSLVAITPSAKAAVETTHAERRLKEAEVLAARGELDPELTQELSERFAVSVDNASTHIEALAADPAEATSASSELESVLTAHGRILDDIIEARNGDTGETLAVLRADIAEREIEAAQKNDEISATLLVNAKDEEVSEQVFEDVVAEAEDAVKELEETAAGLPEEDAAAINNRVVAIESAVYEGRENHEHGEYRNALQNFSEARTFISVGKRLLEAKQRFETNEVVVADTAPEEAPEAANDVAATMTLQATIATTSTSTATSSEPISAKRTGEWGPRPIRIDLSP